MEPVTTFPDLIRHHASAAISFVEFLTEADEDVERDPSKWQFVGLMARCGDVRLRFQPHDLGGGVDDGQWLAVDDET